MHRKSGRSLSAAIAAGWILASCGGGAPARPNVLLVTVDTLRRDHVGLYDYERDTTPHLDAFFGEGTTFERATSPSPCTIPAVLQTLTGALDFDERRPRLAESLRRAGYTTAAVVSQQHFRSAEGPAPAYARGFDSFDVQGAEHVNQHGGSARLAAEVSDGALVWLGARDAQRPFFLWLHYFDPHDPYEPPAEHRVFPEPVPTLDGDRRTPMIADLEAALAAADEATLEEMWARPNRYGHHGSIFSEDEAATLVSYYDAEIRYTDEEIGRVLGALGDAGVLEDTLVVFTADHGERLGEDDRWDHCQSLHGYEIDVPLMVSRRPPGGPARVQHAVSTVDVVPTILRAAGVAFEEGDFDGRDLFAPERPPVYAVWKTGRVLLEDRWKLTVPLTGGQPSLFDVARDPAEERDVAGQHRGRLEAMAGQLREAIRVNNAVHDRVEESLEHLRAIGYVR